MTLRGNLLRSPRMTDAAPYRVVAQPPKPTPPSELFCPWQNVEGANNYLQFVGVILLLLVLVTLAVAVVGGWGLAVVVAGMLGYSRWRTVRPPAGVTLRVDGGLLVLRDERVALDDVVDVERDTKQVERVTLQQPVGAPMMSSVVGPSFDAARVVFVVLDGERERRIPLTNEFAPSYHCTEWVGKIRVFLRKHGWMPDDERQAAAAS
jgi:hypothetical protein